MKILFHAFLPHKSLVYPQAEIHVAQDEAGRIVHRVSFDTPIRGMVSPYGHSHSFASPSEALADACRIIRERIKDPSPCEQKCTVDINDFLDLHDPDRKQPELFDLF